MTIWQGGGCAAGNGSDVITFDPAILPATITLAGSQIEITSSVTIQGPGRERLSISGDSQSRIFNIDDGVETYADVAINGVSIEQGRSSGYNVYSYEYGGAIRSLENLVISDSMLHSNTGNGPGGAIYSSGKLTIELEIIYRQRDMALAELRAGELDVVIAPEGDFAPDIYRSDPLFTERYQVVFAPGHHFETMDSVPLEAISQEVYLDRPNCEMREELLALCSSSNIDIYASYRSNREDWLLLLAAQGVGVAILPESCIPIQSSNIAARPLTSPTLTRNLLALRYRKQPARSEVNALVRSLAHCS